MSDSEPLSKFTIDFVARTKLARKRSGLTQVEVAEILRIDQGTYKQYETRSPLPHRFVAAFCAATHTDAHWLFTGRMHRNSSAAAE